MAQDYIIVGFSTKKNSLISRLICTLTDWRHSHVVLVSPDQRTFIESTGMPFTDPDTGETRDGVREAPVAFMKHRDLVEFRMIPYPEPELLWQEALKLKGAHYDHGYLLGWLLHRDQYQRDNRYTCHEVLTVPAARINIPLIPPDVKRTTPRDIYLLSKPYSGVIL